MYIQDYEFADAVGDASPWFGISGLRDLTLHIVNAVVGDTFRIWGSTFDDSGPGAVPGANGAVEVETALTGAGPHLVKVSQFTGVLAVELDVDGGAPGTPRKMRLMGVHTGNQ